MCTLTAGCALLVTNIQDSEVGSGGMTFHKNNLMWYRLWAEVCHLCS